LEDIRQSTDGFSPLGFEAKRTGNNNDQGDADHGSS
jgi:alpha/beta hydrolase fold